MQLRDIQYAVTVAKELSFSRAAQKLFISQPALSQSIKRLELELGTPLFIRENNTVRLTGAGELFVKEGREIIQLSARLKRSISNIASTRDEILRFGISPFYSKYYLPRIVPVFNRQFPAVTLDIAEKHSAALEELILEEEIEFCLIPLPIARKEIEFEPVYREQIVFAMPRDHVHIRYLTPAMSTGLPFIDLRHVRHEPFIFLKKEQKFTGMGLRLCDEAGFAPRIVFETMNWDTVHALVAGGMGVGFIPEMLIGSSPPGETPVYCRITAEHTTRSYGVAYKKGRDLSAAAHHFIRIAKQTFHTLETDAD